MEGLRLALIWAAMVAMLTPMAMFPLEALAILAVGAVVAGCATGATAVSGFVARVRGAISGGAAVIGALALLLAVLGMAALVSAVLDDDGASHRNPGAFWRR